MSRVHILTSGIKLVLGSAAASCLLGCEPTIQLAPPTDESAFQALVALVDSGRQSSIKVDSFAVGSGRLAGAPGRQNFLLTFRATAHFKEDVVYAGPGIISKQIRVASSESDTLFQQLGYAAQAGDYLVLAGVLGFMPTPNGWELHPYTTDIRAELVRRLPPVAAPLDGRMLRAR